MSITQMYDLSAQQARTALGAVRAVVEAGGSPQEPAIKLLETTALTLGLGHNWQTVPVVTAAEIASAFPSETSRRHLLDALLIPACIEGEVSLAAESTIMAFATALNVDSHWVNLLPAMRKRRVLAVKRQLFARSPDARRIFARTWAEDGFKGLWHVLLFLLGVFIDRPLAAKFHALKHFPQGSLDRHFYDDFQQRGLTFPGERGGMPERMLHHDLMHIINGYSTDPSGECELAGFYAGFAEGDAFTFIVTVLTTFQLGMPVSPAIVLPARGAFDPEKVLAAFLRGKRLRIDIMGPWNYWSLMPMPLEQVRQQLGISDEKSEAPLQHVPCLTETASLSLNQPQ